MMLLNRICRAAMRCFCGHFCISYLLQICPVSSMIVAFHFMTFILSSSSVLLIKGPTAPSAGVLTLPNTWATKLSFTKRSSVNVYYWFLIGHQKALAVLLSLWSYSAYQVLSVMNLVGKVLSWLFHPQVIPADSFPYTHRLDPHHFFLFPWSVYNSGSVSPSVQTKLAMQELWEMCMHKWGGTVGKNRARCLATI